MRVDEMGVDKVGVDEMGSKRSGTTPINSITYSLFPLETCLD